jgi:hypothetical protein
MGSQFPSPVTGWISVYSLTVRSFYIRGEKTLSLLQRRVAGTQRRSGSGGKRIILAPAGIEIWSSFLLSFTELTDYPVLWNLNKITPTTEVTLNLMCVPTGKYRHHGLSNSLVNSMEESSPLSPSSSFRD